MKGGRPGWLSAPPTEPGNGSGASPSRHRSSMSRRKAREIIKQITMILQACRKFPVVILWSRAMGSGHHVYVQDEAGTGSARSFFGFGDHVGQLARELRAYNVRLKGRPLTKRPS
jgi:hypothetical protein